MIEVKNENGNENEKEDGNENEKEDGNENEKEDGNEESNTPADSSEVNGQKRSTQESESLTLPVELRKMFKPLACELCKVTLSSPTTAYAHYQGKTHIKSVNAYMSKHYNVENHFKKRKTEHNAPIKCEVCNIELSSSVVYIQHKAGKKHQKNLNKNQVELPKIVTEIDPTGRFGIGKAFIAEKEAEEETPQLQQQPKKSMFYCDICLIFTDTEVQMAVHKKGQKHAKKVAAKEIMNQYFVKVTKDVNKTEEYYNEDNVWEPTQKKSKPE